MPTIPMFYGLLIRMFFRDDEKPHVPHIHADYQGQVAAYAIQSGDVLVGTLHAELDNFNYFGCRCDFAMI
ncbi:MAG: DUF4160 domain-containing protein [Spirochaetota bacterium]